MLLAGIRRHICITHSAGVHGTGVANSVTQLAQHSLQHRQKAAFAWQQANVYGQAAELIPYSQALRHSCSAVLAELQGIHIINSGMQASQQLGTGRSQPMLGSGE